MPSGSPVSDKTRFIAVNHDRTLGVKEKARVNLQKGYQNMLDDFESQLSDLDRSRVFMTHTCNGDDEVQFLMGEVMRIAEQDELRVTRARSVISSHYGPGTAGILYFLK